jgi:hypothetical protein
MYLCMYVCRCMYLHTIPYIGRFVLRKVAPDRLCQSNLLLVTSYPVITGPQTVTKYEPTAAMKLCLQLLQQSTTICLSLSIQSVCIHPSYHTVLVIHHIIRYLSARLRIPNVPTKPCSTPRCSISFISAFLSLLNQS